MEYHYLQTGASRVSFVARLATAQLARQRTRALPDGAADAGLRDTRIWHRDDRDDRARARRLDAGLCSEIRSIADHLSYAGTFQLGDQRPYAEGHLDVHARIPCRWMPARDPRRVGAGDCQHAPAHGPLMLAPSTPAELAEALRDAAARGQTIALAGDSTKRKMAGPLEPADVTITTLSLRRVVQYEPRDLTVSVGAGLAWRELEHLLAENHQMIPLDPPFADGATVGGVIAANTSGPRRRLYGTARDLVIGMQFATLEGKLVQAGGMVVKNVAGLDMAKLMIGSFGTLAAITTVNFKLQPAPEAERSFLVPFDSLESVVAARDQLLQTQLQPAAIDVLSPGAASGI